MKGSNGDFRNNEADTSKGDNPMLKLEEALVLCKFGRFHIKLMVVTLVSVLATTSVTTSTSFILSNAECDLGLTMMDKGILNGVPFIVCRSAFHGYTLTVTIRSDNRIIERQICTSAFSGFITDAFGRKSFLVYGNLVLFFGALLGGSSQTLWMLFIAKLFEGIVMSVCFTATPAMVSEFTHKDVRDRVLLLYSSFMSTSIIVSALLAWAILPRTLNFVIYEGYIDIHSWNIYLYASSSWSLLAAIMYWQLPESPKYLLSHGQENKALDVLKDIYHENTGKERDTFPMTTLNISGVYKPTKKTTFKKKITDGLYETKELFRGVLLIRLLLFSVIIFVCLLAYSALRLWYPQLSTMIENYEKLHKGESVQFCAVLDDYNERNAKNLTTIHNIEDSKNCVPQIPGYETYTNGILLGVVSLICIWLSVYIVDFTGPKWLSFIFFMLCAVCSSALYWTKSSIQIAILISATCGFVQTAFSLLNSIMVRVFPTTVRTMTLSLILMVGRVGSLLGNIIFPMMLQRGCMAPFIILSGTCVCVGGIIYFLPDANKENSGTDE